MTQKPIEPAGQGGPTSPNTAGRPPGPIRRALRENNVRVGLIIFSLIVLVAIFAPMIAPYDPQERLRTADGELARLLPPQRDYWMGTTNFGRDILSQFIVGTRRTLSVGAIAAFMAVFIGTNVGLIAGFRGGRVDNLLMRTTDAAYALPFLPFAIVLVGIVGRTDLILIAVIGLLFWRTTARVIRSQVLTTKERTFVKAAIAGGASPRRVLYAHIAPNVVALALVYGMLLIAEAVMAEASLSFLGFAPPDSLSWGTIMFDAFTSQRMRQAWWWPMFPGLALMVFMYSVYSVGQGVQRALRHMDTPNIGPSTRRVRRALKRSVSVPVAGDPPDALVAVENLAVTYQPRTPEEQPVPAVKDISFRLDAGQMLGIVGESGSGKTTAVRALLRLLPPTAEVSGGMWFEGRDLYRIGDSELRALRWEHLAFVPQSAMNSLNPVQRVENQIIEAIRVHRDVTRAQAKEMCATALQQVGINPARGRLYPHQYSGGMRQRALIAMAKVLEPTLLVADEPTTGLDVVVQDQIMADLERVREELGTAIIIVSHDLALVSETCSSLIVMRDGDVVEAGPTDRVVSDPRDPYTRMLLSSAHGAPAGTHGSTGA
ncbi:MAG: dipeptide/oligopeptide/nickel ABC transporter permease/ATP-binding protein [bacterium]|nr:dipeptide/oligopeptide/nickel ABC transporter permease/ATP-binding protein [bacterium]